MYQAMHNNNASTFPLYRSPEPRLEVKPAPSEKKAFVRILEQPLSAELRFRYENEERQCIIYGANSSITRKTFPTIEIVNHSGHASVVVSCVTVKSPYYPHPHQLTHPQSSTSKGGVVHLRIQPGQPIFSFQQLRLVCAKRSEAARLLEERRAEKINPYHTDFDSIDVAKDIDFSCFRLCFQVYLLSETTTKNKYKMVALEPIMSEPIYDKKTLPVLKIYYVSHHSAPVTGGQTMVLLTDKIKKGEVQLKFFCEKTKWEVIPETVDPHYHKHVAIIFKSPSYPRLDITKPVEVKLQLKRLIDGAVSEAIPFLLTPVESMYPELHVKKRLKSMETPRALVLERKNLEAMQMARMVDNRVQNRNYFEPDTDFYLDNILSHLSPMNRQNNLIS